MLPGICLIVNYATSAGMHFNKWHTTTTTRYYYYYISGSTFLLLSADEFAAACLCDDVFTAEDLAAAAAATVLLALVDDDDGGRPTRRPVDTCCLAVRGFSVAAVAAAGGGGFSTAVVGFVLVLSFFGDTGAGESCTLLTGWAAGCIVTHTNTHTHFILLSVCTLPDRQLYCRLSSTGHAPELLMEISGITGTEFLHMPDALLVTQSKVSKNSSQ